MTKLKRNLTNRYRRSPDSRRQLYPHQMGEGSRGAHSLYIETARIALADLPAEDRNRINAGICALKDRLYIDVASGCRTEHTARQYAQAAIASVARWICAMTREEANHD